MSTFTEKPWTESRWSSIENQHKNPEYLKIKIDYGWNEVLTSVSFKGLIKSLHAKTVLDYGCGLGHTFDSLKPEVDIINYDPWIPEYATFPTGTYDLVISCSMLNNVDPHFMDDVLINIKKFSKGPVLLIISINNLEDSPIAQTLKYYLDKINEHFKIILQMRSLENKIAINGARYYHLFLYLEKIC